MADIGRSPKLASKFQNTRVDVDGLKFASKAEAARYGELRLLERAGLIRELRVQVRFELVPSVQFKGVRRRVPATDYVADFTYLEKCKPPPEHSQYGRITVWWRDVVEDCKGAKTRVYLMKKHMMLALLGLEIRESRPR